MMKYVVAALMLMLVVAQTNEEWDSWKVKHGKSYATPEEEVLRRSQWDATYKAIKDANAASAAAAANGATNVAYYALNAFSDSLPQENTARLGGVSDVLHEPGTRFEAVSGNEARVSVALPTQLSWITPGVITPIKNQANCGCCWSFSATAYIESIAIIKYNKTFDLSEQYLLECTASSDCGGGYVSKAMNLSLNGMPNETLYSYTAGNWGTSGRPNNGICGTASLNTIPSATVTIYNNVTDTQLKTMLTNSPIPALISATSLFQSYTSGTFSCSNTSSMTINDLNHAIQIVGYNSDGDYIIKNSWGTTWGANGYATVDSTLDCGIKQVVYEFVSSTANVITWNTTANNTTNNTTNNSTTNNSTNLTTKAEWNMVFMFVLAFISMIVMA